MSLKLLLFAVCLQLVKNATSNERMPLTYKCSTTEQEGLTQCIIDEMTNMREYLTINNPVLPYNRNHCVDFWGRSVPADSNGNCIYVQYIDLSLTDKELTTKQAIDLQAFSPLFWKRMNVERSDNETIDDYYNYTNTCHNVLSNNFNSGIFTYLYLPSHSVKDHLQFRITMFYCSKSPNYVKNPTNADESINFPQCSRGVLKDEGEYLMSTFLSGDQLPMKRDEYCHYSESLDISDKQNYNSFENKCRNESLNGGCMLGIKMNQDSAGNTVNATRLICCSMAATDDSYKSKLYNRKSGSPYAPLGEAILGVRLLREKIEPVKDKCFGLVDPDNERCFIYFNLINPALFDIGDGIYLEREIVYKSKSINIQLTYPDKNAIVPYLYFYCSYSISAKCDFEFYNHDPYQLLNIASLTRKYCLNDDTQQVIQLTVFACAIEMTLINNQVDVHRFPVQGWALSSIADFKNNECKDDGLNKVICLCRPTYKTSSKFCNDLKNFEDVYKKLSKRIVRPVSELHLFSNELQACGHNHMMHNETKQHLFNSIDFKPNIMCYGTPDDDSKLVVSKGIYFDQQVNPNFDFLSLVICEQALKNSEATLSGCNCAFNELENLRICCCKPNISEEF